MSKRGKKNKKTGDALFGSKKRKAEDKFDDVIDSDSEEDNEFLGSNGEIEARESESEQDVETPAEKRRRIAMEHLQKLREITQKVKDVEDEDEDEERARISGVGGEGGTDALVAQILQQEQLESSGRARREIAARIKKPEDEFRVLVKHRKSVTAVALSEDDCKGFSSSKDGTILSWDVDTGKVEKYPWPSMEVLRSHGAKDPQGRVKRHSKQVFALAVSSDGRYLASGGADRHVHLWDIRTREHIQAFPGHRGSVSCLAFRQGTSELFSGSYDRTVKIWNAEDRAYINTLFGHQDEVLTIDCLRKERVLTVGRDRTMQLFKVPEESRLVFRAPASSLECCCFVGNDEYLSGSDDGSIELWSSLRKKPVCIVKNAHGVLPSNKDSALLDSGSLLDGYIDNSNHNHFATAYSWVSSVTVCRGSDLAASGAGNGSVRLWAVKRENKEIQQLYELPLVGFVNSLTFAKSGKFLVAGIGEEPRVGRWGRLPAAQNGVAIQSLEYL